MIWTKSMNENEDKGNWDQRHNGHLLTFSRKKF